MRTSESKHDQSLEERVDALVAQVQSLQARVDELSQAARPTEKASAPTEPSTEKEAGQAEPSEEFLSWVGSSSLLQRIAAVCFLLVVALVLRTLADSALIDPQVGSLLGMVYAGCLIFAGWYLYGRSSPLAQVFSVCGSLLMYLIVVETYARFDSLPSEAAYVLIIGTGAAMALISYLQQVSLPILVGTFGMFFAGIAIDYPTPSYPALGVLLFSANILGFVASRLQRCSWLRWTLLVITVVLLQVWGYKLGLTLAGIAHPDTDMAPSWYLPVVLVFAVGFLASSLYGMWRPLKACPARFDYALPALNALWAFTAIGHVAQPLWDSTFGFGLLGLCAAAAHLGLALLVKRKTVAAAAAGASLFLAAAVLLELSLVRLFASPLPYLFALGLITAWALWLSERWQSGALRLLAYLGQVFLAFDLGRLFLGNEALNQAPASPLAAGGLAMIVLLQFIWCRGHEPDEHSRFFARFDETDRLALLLLVASLVQGYFALRSGVWQVLVLLADRAGPMLQSAESIILNGGAAVLMACAYIFRDRDIRSIAILVTLIGAGKVFLFDLFGPGGLGIDGFPLVLSVLSFGVVIALESVILTAWQRGAEKGGSR